jgi:hypothetical protein
MTLCYLAPGRYFLLDKVPHCAATCQELRNDILEHVGGRILENKALACLAFFLLYAVAVIAKPIRTWYRLRHFKGPLWAAFSKWWLVRHVVRGSTFRLLPRSPIRPLPY